MHRSWPAVAAEWNTLSPDDCCGNAATCSSTGQRLKPHSQSWQPGRLQRVHQKLLSLSCAMMNQPCSSAQVMWRTLVGAVHV